MQCRHETLLCLHKDLFLIYTLSCTCNDMFEQYSSTHVFIYTIGHEPLAVLVLTWQLPTGTLSKHTVSPCPLMILTIISRMTTSINTKDVKVSTTTSHQLLMHLAQRGQAGGSNVCIPEQGCNPKHSLHSSVTSAICTLRQG